MSQKNNYIKLIESKINKADKYTLVDIYSRVKDIEMDEDDLNGDFYFFENAIIESLPQLDLEQLKEIAADI